MIAAAEIGAAWAVDRAALEADPEAARALMRRGQVIAFNAAANCWPGWDDEGAVITDAHIAAGLALAVRSRTLVRQMELEAGPQGTAHWLVGALELAAGRTAEARAAFEASARAYAPLGADSAEALMARGYLALAQKVGGLEDGLDGALARLLALASDKGRFFAQQIETADRVFAARAATV